MRPLISRAASALRPAKLRTSLATTAKPRPASPARAASTAAFKARMLVWKAMPSMTPMMSLILRELSVMPCMVCVTCCTTAPPRVADSLAVRASALASVAVAAFCLTVAVISSIEAAVCSTLAAVCSVRAERSWLPCTICSLVAPKLPTCTPTSSSSARRFKPVWLTERMIWPISSTRLKPLPSFRLPPATSCAFAANWRNGAAIWRCKDTVPKPSAKV